VAFFELADGVKPDQGRQMLSPPLSNSSTSSTLKPTQLQSTGNSPVQSTLGPSPVVFETFDECPASDVARTINSSQSKMSEPDPFPTDILKQFLQELLPYITDMCNASLQEGCLSTSQRRVIVSPRLKKSGPDEADVSNYQSVSNLTFMLKVAERLVCQQFCTFLEKHSLLPSHQSAYWRHHSTETAVLKIVLDLLLACD